MDETSQTASLCRRTRLISRLTKVVQCDCLSRPVQGPRAPRLQEGPGQAMNFDFSPDQQQLRDQTRRFLEEHSSTKAARAILENGGDYDKSLWKGMAELGLIGVAIPEEFGGAGAGQLETLRRGGRARACACAGPLRFDSVPCGRVDHGGRHGRAETDMAAQDCGGRRDRHPRVRRGAGESLALRHQAAGGGRRALRHQDTGAGRQRRGLSPSSSRARARARTHAASRCFSSTSTNPV